MLRCAVIGVGYLGQFHAQKYKNYENTNPQSGVSLVGVYDAFQQNSEKVANSLNVKRFENLKDLVGQVDAVTIAASTKSHFEIAEFCLKNKIAVNVEKPMTATLDEAQRLYQVAIDTGVPLSVGHIERFNPSILEFKKHLKGLKHLHLQRVGPFRARGADVSVLYDLMIHDLDLALWLTGSVPESWSCTGSRLVGHDWDTCQAYFKMKNGIHVSLDISRVSPQASRSLRATQEDSTIFVNTGTFELARVESSGQGLQSAEPLKITNWSAEKKDALQEETNSFIEAVLNKKSMPVSAEDGLAAMKWISILEKEM